MTPLCISADNGHSVHSLIHLVPTPFQLNDTGPSLELDEIPGIRPEVVEGRPSRPGIGFDHPLNYSTALGGEISQVGRDMS